MNAMHLASLDLNLLRVFDVLLEERSVTRAGARLGLTPSAVSHALSRLRYHLGDELFPEQVGPQQLHDGETAGDLLVRVGDLDGGHRRLCLIAEGRWRLLLRPM